LFITLNTHLVLSNAALEVLPVSLEEEHDRNIRLKKIKVKK